MLVHRVRSAAVSFVLGCVASPAEAPDAKSAASPDTFWPAGNDASSRTGEDSRTGPSEDVSIGPGPALGSAAPGPGPSATNASLFDPGGVIEIALTVADADWETLMGYRSSGTKEYVPCGFVVDGEAATAAAIRLKSNPEDWDGNKPQFVVKFNEYDKSGRFRGLRRVVLEANPSDEALIRNNLSMRLMTAAGVPAPRANHARVTLNGAFYGLYEHLEAIDREFLEDRFAEPDGNLYKNGEELSTNEDVGDTRDLTEFDDLIYDTPTAARREAITQLIDIRAFIRQAAVEAVLPAGDNFWSGGWNYYLYHPPGALWTILPWDLDDVIGKAAPVDAGLLDFNGVPEAQNEPHPLMLDIRADAEWRAMFLAEVARVESEHYRGLGAVAQTLCDRIRPSVAEDPSYTGDIEDFDAECAAIRASIEARSAAVQAELEVLSP